MVTAAFWDFRRVYHEIFAYNPCLLRPKFYEHNFSILHLLAKNTFHNFFRPTFLNHGLGELC